MSHVFWPICSACGGEGVRNKDHPLGREPFSPCPTCQGAGRVKPPWWVDPPVLVPCAHCQGSGEEATVREKIDEVMSANRQAAIEAGTIAE